MKWTRILIVFVVLLLVGGIAFLAASVHLRLTSAEYQFQVDAVLAAAKVANGEEPVTDPARAVVAEYEGKRWVVVPGNYLALSSFLRKDAFARLFTKPDPERALTLTVCGEARFTLSPDETGDRVTVMLEPAAYGRLMARYPEIMQEIAP